MGTVPPQSLLCPSRITTYRRAPRRNAGGECSDGGSPTSSNYLERRQAGLHRVPQAILSSGDSQSNLQLLDDDDDEPAQQQALDPVAHALGPRHHREASNWSGVEGASPRWTSRMYSFGSLGGDELELQGSSVPQQSGLRIRLDQQGGSGLAGGRLQAVLEGREEEGQEEASGLPPGSPVTATAGPELESLLIGAEVDDEQVRIGCFQFMWLTSCTSTCYRPLPPAPFPWLTSSSGGQGHSPCSCTWIDLSW